MTDRNPAHATPLELPPAALNAPLHRKPHPDSEESVQYERQRVSRELEPYVHSSSRPSTDTSRPPRATPSFASLRSRNAAQRNSADPSQEHLARHDSTTSNATTQPDIPGASEAGRLSTRSFVKVPHWYDPIARFWTTHVCPSMDEGAYRDHLALERTFLGYLRTSLILVMTGITIAQLFRLQRSPNPDPVFGFYVVGLPLSITFISMAVLVLLLGAIRFWRLQRGLLAGKAHAGGWELILIMGLISLLLLATFALLVGIDIDKSYSEES